MLEQPEETILLIATFTKCFDSMVNLKKTCRKFNNLVKFHSLKIDILDYDFNVKKKNIKLKIIEGPSFVLCPTVLLKNGKYSQSKPVFKEGCQLGEFIKCRGMNEIIFLKNITFNFKFSVCCKKNYIEHSLLIKKGIIDTKKYINDVNDINKNIIIFKYDLVLYKPYDEVYMGFNEVYPKYINNMPFKLKVTLLSPKDILNIKLRTKRSCKE